MTGGNMLVGHDDDDNDDVDNDGHDEVDDDDVDDQCADVIWCNIGKKPVRQEAPISYMIVTAMMMIIMIMIMTAMKNIISNDDI